MDALFDSATLDVTIRSLAPILLLAYGGHIASRCGIFNIALEGTLLLSAFFAVWGSYTFNNANVGILAAVAAGIAFSLLLAITTVTFNADEIVVGVALNLLAVGLAGFLLRTIFGARGSFDDPRIQGLGTYDIPLVENVPLLRDLLSSQTAIVYLALLLLPLLATLINKTKFGLRLRGTGTNPEAAESLGVNTTRIRYQALALCGVTGGLAGAQLSIGQITLFSTNMSAGRGWIAVVVVMIAGASVMRTFLTALVFTFVIAAGLRLQTTGLPVQFTVAVPFIAAFAAIVLRGRLKSGNAAQ